MLVDYSKHAATTNAELAAPFGRSQTAPVARRSQPALEACRRHSVVTPCAATATDAAINTPKTPITFRLRSTIRSPKPNFLDADMDMDLCGLGSERGQEKDALTTLITQSCHSTTPSIIDATQTSTGRRNNLKKTFQKTQSMRNLNLDSSPICLADSIHEQPTTSFRRGRSLPGRCKTFNGATSPISSPQKDEASAGTSPVHNTKRTMHSLPTHKGTPKAAALFEFGSEHSTEENVPTHISRHRSLSPRPPMVARDVSDAAVPPTNHKACPPVFLFPEEFDTPKPTQQRPQRHRSLSPPRPPVVSRDASDAAVAPSVNHHKESHSPVHITSLRHANSANSSNRRTMMKKQASFITGSRIRTLN